MDPKREMLRAITRRELLRGGMGVGAMALASLLDPNPRSASAAEATDTTGTSLAPKPTHHPPKAKSVIYIHLAGSPSTLDLFDYKPKLVEMNGKPCPDEFLGQQFAFIKGHPKLLGTPHPFAQYGESGQWMSNLLPNLAKVADELAVIRSMVTDQFNHAPAQLMLHTGSPRLGRPSMGSWLSYGLGTENLDLPAFVVLMSGPSQPDGGTSLWGSAFLPTIHQGVPFRSSGDPVLFLSDPPGMDRDLRRRSLDTLEAINRMHLETVGDPEILTRINQFELAFKMQTSVPELMDIRREPESIHRLYGTEPGKRSFANNCLLARRLVEQGVRFVQLYDWGWDQHGTSADNDLLKGLPRKCGESDQAVAALIMDLKSRGLLDETLVIWGGEFGRTPMNEERNGSKFLGRDHHQHAFTMWIAGGGAKRGLALGETDELGYRSVTDIVHVHDLQATILHLLGIDHTRLTYRFQGRDFRLTDVHGNIVEPLLA